MASPQSDNSLSMKLAVKSIKLKWPKVKTIETTTLYDWITDRQLRKTIALLDARPMQEYVISHIDGARRVDPECGDIQETLEYLQKHNKEHLEVVCYCSLGYRSTLYADTLTRALKKDCGRDFENVPNVYNLEGSLFKWANEGKPIINSEGQATKFVHPYNAVWGKLLCKELRKSNTN